ncbi:C-type lectin domain family 4 member E-like [Chanodichthys erythropterus]|uniref:C-type lectin domain family 4 member E-like n=1 Tax=Chanodichthys erythropterus TaxID=933992 RepID=UPI00351F79D7
MSYYGNMDIQHEMDREDDEEMNIYINVDPINSSHVRTETENSETKRQQTPQHTGSDTVRNRSSRASSVCLVLLCVLLLTAVIVLCVLINSKSTNCSEETHQLLTQITNLTEERDQLQIKITNLTEARDELLSKNMQLAKERDISSSNLELIKHRDQLNKEKNELSKNEWIYYKSSLYFLSTEKKSWTESRRYCTLRGADLIIINNSEEQGFVKKISAGVKVWIGLTDGDKEGRWKWVDSSTLTFRFWTSGEPNSYGGIDEDCAVNYEPGWADFPCNHLMQWICEKVILK